MRERLLFRRLAVGEIDVPPYETQQRFATAMLVVARARAAAKARLEAAKQLVDATRRAVLEKGRSWPRVPVKDLLNSPLRTGISKSRLDGSRIRCLTLSSVRPDEYLDMTHFKPVDLSDEEAAANSIKPGAFYVVRGNGNLAFVGRGGMAPDQVEDGVVFPDLLIEVNLRRDLISGRFLRLVWDFNEIRSDIERRARTSAGIHKINLRNLSEVRIPVPTLEVQRSVANELADRFERASEISSAACAEARELQALPGALLRSAFRGEM